MYTSSKGLNFKMYGVQCPMIFIDMYFFIFFMNFIDQTRVAHYIWFGYKLKILKFFYTKYFQNELP